MNIHLYTMHFSLTMCFVTLLLSKLSLQVIFRSKLIANVV